jgi:hypothetical protein
MDSRLSQPLIAIRTAEALDQAATARAVRDARRRHRLGLTLPGTGAMIGAWRAGSRAR